MTISSPGRPAMYASHSLGSSVAQRSSAADRNSLLLGKPIDLNSSTSSRDRQTGEPVTKRAFHIDVVLEGDRKDRVDEATRDLLAQLGKPLSYSSFISEATAPNPSKLSGSAPGTPTKALKAGKQDPIKLGKIINELQETEQGYLRRISYLKSSYADPLRKFAKRKETTIIPLYEANVIFANIDNLVTSAESFCRDLQLVDLSGRALGHGIGDICLRHLKELGTFDGYKAYYDRQDESQRALQEMFKRQSFQTFTEGVKYQTSGIGNSGIRELLAEPVQRIPRYLLLWQAMIDSMSAYDAQRTKLEECIVLASKIAACEADERIKRATVMYCMERTVDAFPANLISNNRDYIDSIDVEDNVADTRGTGSISQSNSPMRPSLSHHTTSPAGVQSRTISLHCTLILFDDKLVIVKRVSAAINGRKVTGLDSIDRMMKAGGGLNGLAHSGTTFTKDKLEFQGVVDILDVIATDVGNSEFELFFEKPPADQGAKWTGRPFRHYQVVHPPMPVNLEYTPTRIDKQRFVQNIWKAQALARTKRSATAHRGNNPGDTLALPVAFVSNENKKLGGSDRLAGQAIAFWNVWERQAWIANPRKSKVVLHVDETGTAASLPLAEQQNPRVIIRATPSSAATCRVSVATADCNEGAMQTDVIRTRDIDDKVIETINVFGLYRFRTSNASLPGTPTHSYRLRPSAINLDSISRNLFGSSTISSRLDSTVGSRKSRSVVSRSSTIDTGRFSLESKSTIATSVSHDIKDKTPSPGRARKSSSPHAGHNLSGMSPKRDIFSIDENRYTSTVGDVSTLAVTMATRSDADLDSQLDLARRNSASVATSGYAAACHAAYGSMDGKAMCYEGPPSPQKGSLMVRNRTPSPPTDPVGISCKASATTPLHVVRPLDLSRRKTPSPTPNRVTAVAAPTPSRSMSINTPENKHDMFSPTSPQLGRTRSVRSNTPAAKPSGPRSVRSGTIRSQPAAGSSYTTLQVATGSGRIVSPGRDTMPLQEITNDGSRISPTAAHKRARSQEELAPRKRSADYTTSTSTSNASTVKADEERNKSLSGGRLLLGPKLSQRQVSSSTAASPIRADHDRKRTSGNHGTLSSYHATEHAVENTDEHIKIAMRTSRNIRAEMLELNMRLGRDIAAKDRIRKIDSLDPSMCRSPPSKRLARRAEPDFGELAPVYGSMSSRRSTHSSKGELDVAIIDDWTLNVSGLLDQLDHDLEQAKMGSGRIESVVAALKLASQKRGAEVTALQQKLNAVSARNDLDKSQISDLQSELEAVYEAFNVELDGMFADANLPPTEAFAALRRDLQNTKAQRNDLRLDNIKLRRQLEDSKFEKEEMRKLIQRLGDNIPSQTVV